MSSVGSMRAEIARATRSGDLERANRVRQSYYTEILAEKITETVAKAPPLRPEQIERLRSLLPLPAEHDDAQFDQTVTDVAA